MGKEDDPFLLGFGNFSGTMLNFGGVNKWYAVDMNLDLKFIPSDKVIFPTYGWKNKIYTQNTINSQSPLPKNQHIYSPWKYAETQKESFQQPQFFRGRYYILVLGFCWFGALWHVLSFNFQSYATAPNSNPPLGTVVWHLIQKVIIANDHLWHLAKRKVCQGTTTLAEETSSYSENTPLKFNSSPLKNDAWKTILSFWEDLC